MDKSNEECLTDAVSETKKIIDSVKDKLPSRHLTEGEKRDLWNERGWDNYDDTDH